MMIKHIFTDMDGTLLDDAGKISEFNRATIHASKLPVTLVSARSPIEMVFAIDQLALKAPQISFNGNLIYTKESSGIKVLEKHPLPSLAANQLLTFIASTFPNVSLSWYTLDKWYILKHDKGTEHQTKLTGILPTCQSLGQQTEIFKIMLMTFDSQEMNLLQEKLLALSIAGISIKQSGAWYLEITSDAMSKADAVSNILQQEQITFDEIAAIGDGHNDLPLLEKAGLPIAVKNAHAEVISQAKMVVAKNIDNGVAEAILAIQKMNR